MTEVLYRKYRPQSFAEVAGQEAITRTLRNSIASGKLAHAYLLCGPRGTGKTTLGRLVAKAANCAAPVDGEPCNACDSCVAFLEGRAMDFVEQDAASHNSVEDIRQLRENVILTPMAGERKVYLLDEVHMLSGAAQNALLKTLEEPPPHIIFVLATTESHKVSGTIVSRCQRFDLKRIPMGAAVDRLSFICEKEGLSVERESLEEIARAATGSLRDAINALEQVVTYYGRAPSHEQVREALGLSVDVRSGQLARMALSGDLTGGLKLIAEVRDDGVEIKQFNKQVVKYMRGLLLAKAGATDALELPQEMAAEVKAEAANTTKDDILRALGLFGRLDFREDASSLLLELAFVEFASAIGETRQRRTPEPTPAPRAVQRPAVPPAPAPKPEPQVSIPPTHVDAVESTVTAATLQPPVQEPPPPAPEPERPAPQPVAEGAPAPPPSDDLLSRVRVALKETDKQLSFLLNGSCEVKSEDGDVVVLGFYHTFHLERVETGAYRDKLSQAFSSVLGRAVTVKWEHTPQERPEGSDRSSKGGHLVQAAREMGARAVPPE